MEDQVKEWEQKEGQEDAITGKTREVVREVGEATTELVRKVIRDGMETERIHTIEEFKLYRYNEYIILDPSWGQYAIREGDRIDRTKTIFRG